MVRPSPPKNCLPKRSKSIFEKNVDFELAERREKNREKVEKSLEKQFREKIQLYQQKVDQYYKPKVDTSLSVVQAIPKAYSSVCLTKAERVEKGLEYLAKAKEMKKDVTKDKKASSPTSQTKEDKTEKQQPQSQKGYKNYLKREVPYNPLRK